MYTHSVSHAHFFLIQFLCVTYRPRAHVWLRAFAVRTSHLSISPSPLSCFIRLPCCSLAVTSRPPSRLRRPRLPCRTVPDPKAQVKRTSVRAARRLAAWSIPRTPQFHQLTCKVTAGNRESPAAQRTGCVCVSRTGLARARIFLTIRTTITSLTSPKSHARILSSSVFP